MTTQLTPAQVKEKVLDYLRRHDELSRSYYSGKSGLSKEEFDRQHGAIWTEYDAFIKTVPEYIP